MRYVYHPFDHRAHIGSEADADHYRPSTVSEIVLGIAAGV